MNYINDIKSQITDFIDQNPKSTIIIRWTTASWKTALSIELADFLDIEIISSDSRQIFKYMDIWTDKVDKSIRERITHHQIDIINPDQTYTAWQRQSDTKKIISDCFSRSKLPLIVGWTWLYIDTIYKNFQMPSIEPNFELRKELFAEEEKNIGYLRNELNKIDPKSASQIHPKSTRYLVRAIEIYHQAWLPKSVVMTSQIPDFPILMIWLWKDKPLNDQQIIDRIDTQIQRGRIEEVEFLIKKWYWLELQSMQSIGYRQIAEYLGQQITKEQMLEQTVFATIRYAKKQRTRLRKYIRDAKDNPTQNVKYLVYEI